MLTHQVVAQFFFTVFSTHSDDFKFHDMMQAFTFSVLCLWILALQQRFQLEVWLLCERLSVAVLHPYTAAETIPSLGDVVTVKHRCLTVAKKKKKTRTRLQLFFGKAKLLSTTKRLISWCCSFSTEHGRLFWLMQALIIDSSRFIICVPALPMVH